MTNFKSSKKYYYFLRFGLISIAMMFLLGWILAVYLGIEISINGENQIATVENSLFVVVIPIILVIIHLIINPKISYVQIIGQDINIQSRSGILKKMTTDIDAINQIQFVNPPLYKLKFKDSKKSYIFVINKLYVQFGGYVADLSSDSKNIKGFNK
jgi:hypothetical protein